MPIGTPAQCAIMDVDQAQPPSSHESGPTESLFACPNVASGEIDILQYSALPFGPAVRRR